MNPHLLPKGMNRPMPDDFPQWAIGKTTKQIKAHYRCSYESAQHWRSLCEHPQLPKKRSKEPMPADFKSVAPGLTLVELREHYGRHYRSVRRWLDEAGITPVRPTYKPRI